MEDVAPERDRGRSLLLICSVAINIVLGAFAVNSALETPDVTLTGSSLTIISQSVSPEYQARVAEALHRPDAALLDAELSHRQASQHFMALLTKENLTLEELSDAMGRARTARNVKNAAYHRAFAEVIVSLPQTERLKIRDAMLANATGE